MIWWIINDLTLFGLSLNLQKYYKPLRRMRHILDNNLYMPSTHRDYISSHIFLWLTTKYAYFRRRSLNCILGWKLNFCVAHITCTHPPTHQQSIYLRRRSNLNIRMFAKNIEPYTITFRSLTGRYKIYVYCPRAKFAISSNHKHFRF